MVVANLMEVTQRLGVDLEKFGEVVHHTHHARIHRHVDVDEHQHLYQLFSLIRIANQLWILDGRNDCQVLQIDV